MPDTQTTPTFDHVLVITNRPGYWGRGTTFAEAVKNAKYIRSDESVSVYRCTADARVDGMGYGYGVGDELARGVVSKLRRSLKTL